MDTYLITGAAGFIGFHLSRRLLADGHQVTGLDNLTPYYDVQLKKQRIALLQEHEGFTFFQEDMSNAAVVETIFRQQSFSHVVNLAAQAGVRYSLENPRSYVDANIVGFFNILENCRQYNVQHFIFASSSSVYGLNTNMPFSVHDNVDHPISLYAASKKSNELMAHSYSHLFKLPCTGLRFFTVYGPWGRPDMALFIFTKAILEGRPIPVFNHGNMRRDFTYIDDIIEGVVRVAHKPASPNPRWDSNEPDPGSSPAPYRLYNIGNNNTVELSTFIKILEKELGKTAVKDYLPMQPGDVPATCADIDDLQRDFGFQPATPIEVGIHNFVAWYREYYQCQQKDVDTEL
jgi:UDP-glucuronate 4-epimerase